MRLTAGTKLGPYEIIDALGAGGMGEVYRARDSRLRRDVAIKVVHSAEADWTTWERFEREARAASALSHPNICTVFDTGEADGQPYLVMELLEGQTLKDRIGSQPIESTAAVAIAVQIADALEAAHAKGILHRDIKPGNVMIIGRGHVKVLDFGLAKQTTVGETDETVTLRTETQAGHVMGTPAYLSPEVLKGSKADARSDLWAFGVVLYQMLSGRLPFRGATTLEISSGILKEVPPPLPASVPQGLRAIVERCLEKKPEKRYQNAGEIRLALEGLHAGPAVAPARRTWLWAGGAIAVVALGLMVWIWQRPGVATLSTGGPRSAIPEANVLFEQGVLAQRVQNDLPRAQEMYQQALALDPQFAEARRYHAFDYIILFLNGYTNDTGTLDKAEEELRQVAREAPDLPSLPAAQAALFFVMGRQELIPMEALDRAAERVTSSDAGLWRMILYMYKGENGPAKKLAQLALAQNSLMGPVRQLYAEILRTEGDSEGAVAELQTVLRQAPSNITATSLLSVAYLDRNEPAKARQLLEEKRPLFEKNYLWRQSWALLLASEGNRKAASETMDPETLQWAKNAYLYTGFNADFYAMQGEQQKAIESLRDAVRNGDERVEWFRRNPRFAKLQKDPDFLRMIESIEARRAKQ